jgi:transposase
MPKRKLEDFKDDTQFRFWGIVISRFVWQKSRSEVATAFFCSEQYVTKVMNKFEEDGGYIDHRQFNRAEHLKTKLSVEKAIVKTLKKKPNSSSTQLQETVAKKGYDVSDRCIRNIRKELGYTKIATSLLPNLSEANLESRMKYRREEDDKPHLTKPRNNQKIMVWGGISRKGQTHLKIYRLDQGETVTAESYVDCLKKNLIDFMEQRHGQDKWRLVQDNARPHTAGHTQDFLEGKNIKVIVHPPYSPDLNPIEKVWAWMKSEIGQTTYDDIKDLIKVVKRKWDSMTISYQNSLIDHHMSVIRKVYDSGGAYV